MTFIKNIFQKIHTFLSKYITQIAFNSYGFSIVFFSVLLGIHITDMCTNGFDWLKFIRCIIAFVLIIISILLFLSVHKEILEKNRKIKEICVKVYLNNEEKPLVYWFKKDIAKTSVMDIINILPDGIPLNNMFVSLNQSVIGSLYNDCLYEPIFKFTEEKFILIRLMESQSESVSEEEIV